MNVSMLDALLDKYCRDLSPNNGLTAVKLKYMATARFDQIEPDLHALCRKIHVSKCLKITYNDDGWGSGSGHDTAPGCFYKLATILLLKSAVLAKSPGLSAKWLNASLACKDLYVASLSCNDVPSADFYNVFETQVEQVLEKLVPRSFA